MEHKQKAAVAICLLLTFFSSFLALPASANSAQHDWNGRDESGVMTVDGDCPLIVEHETLTFDLQEFPKYDTYNEDKLLSYTGRVSAEYTFYNPSDMTITTKLAFPLTSTFQTYAGKFTDYQITVNGQTIDAEIRHTLSLYTEDFSVENDLPRLKDDYVTDDFFTSGNLTVTKYTISMPDFEGGEYWGGPRCGIDINPTNYPNTVFYFPEHFTRYHNLDDGTYRVYTERVYPWTTIEYYAIGEEPHTLPKFKVYNDWHCLDSEVLAVGTSTVKTKTMTLNDLVFMDYDKAGEVSEIDWYNAKVELLQRKRAVNNPICLTLDLNDWSVALLMVWYCYEVTFEPGERIINKVSAPMYPDVNTWRKPTRYTYTYLLSPAGTWSSFGDIDIYINTPFYISNSSLGKFEVTENGYKMHLDELQKDENGKYKELTFTLTSEEIPIVQKAPGFFKSIWIAIVNFFKSIGAFFAGIFNFIFKRG